MDTTVTYEEAEKLWRDLQLPPASYSFISNEDAIVWIQKEILPNVKNYVNTELQRVTIPYGYPIDILLLQSVYPTLNELHLQTMMESWDHQIGNAVKFLALCELWKLVDSTEESYLVKAESFCALGRKYLDVVLAGLCDVINKIPDRQQKGNQVGLITIKLPKSKCRMR